jgi:hypothetical protein
MHQPELTSRQYHGRVSTFCFQRYLKLFNILCGMPSDKLNTVTNPIRQGKEAETTSCNLVSHGGRVTVSFFAVMWSVLLQDK